MNYKVYNILSTFGLLEEDIRINSELVLMEGSKRSFLINSAATTIFLESLIEALEDFTGASFETYVKNIYSFEDLPTQVIDFPKQILDDIDVISDYSFLYLIKGDETEITFKSDKIFIKDGDLVVFKTDEFVEQQSPSNNRIGLFGSVSNKFNKESNKITLI